MEDRRVIAATEGIANFHAVHPDVPVFTASIDSHLNEKGYIVPGLGDAIRETPCGCE